ncbi:MAG TPA: hypothetical protein VG477_12390, partial [Thermoanaerobaculia bacterium]|nr:hypothetical protein [Thermoanaerobaculia bacterium]
MQAVERLHTLGRRLPGDCLAVFEARLGPGEGPVDLSIRLRDRSEAGRVEGLPLPPHLAAFLSAWAEPDGPFAPVRSVWLEFDLDRDPEGLPCPIPSAKLAGPVDPDWLTGTLLPALHGKPLSPEQREAVRFCLAALPAPGSLLYAFSLFPRNPGAVRLEAVGQSREEILETLRRVAPRTEQCASQAAPLFGKSGRFHLFAFDLTSEVLPRIGIEASFARQPAREPGWEILFQELVAAGLCTPGKRDAALAWSGYDTFRTAPEAWPLEAAGHRGFFVRSLSHVKV